VSTERVFTLTESVATTLELTAAEAEALRAIGRRMARQASGTEEAQKSLIECLSLDGKTWRVRVMNAVGVIGLPGDVKIIIRPKIPVPHLVFLLQIGGVLPRNERSAANFSSALGFQELIAAWFIDSLEALFRGGLERAYVLQRSKLPIVRGRIDVRVTAVDFARGDQGISCEYEELLEDTPLNRILIAAARRIARSDLMPSELRRRARTVTHSVPHIGVLRRNDLRFQPDRLAARYIDAVSMARLLLDGAGVGFEDGEERGASFLLPTPLAIESALRRLVADSLLSHARVRKGKLPLGSSGLTINPDLVIGDVAIGDVKYKIWQGSWERPDLYQIVTFAIAYGRNDALHIGFGGAHSEGPLQVGHVNVWRVAWNVSEELLPEESAVLFQEQVHRWWVAVNDPGRRWAGSGVGPGMLGRLDAVTAPFAIEAPSTLAPSATADALHTAAADS